MNLKNKSKVKSKKDEKYWFGGILTQNTQLYMCIQFEYQDDYIFEI
jgi:hypothetical protein